ncbi:MAG: NmrA family NAD(P)-binding protein, partial [Verrucomicrobia bacterium]|nr:NmrA family NAD(P)-binding protein [Verrucomicrobiota bacterium]
MDSKPVVLILGATGQVGGLISDTLLDNKQISLRVSSRKRDLLPSLKQKYGDAVYLDLDDPRTFPDALQGVERLFLLTGYSVHMLVQSKAMVDAAKKAGVKHIVHLGVFTPEPDCYDEHFAWHQMIEVYIKDSGIPYTFLHPNCFLQNFTGFYKMAKSGKLIFYTDKKVGWIALEDVAEAAAKILIEGPRSHQDKNYWFSTESLNIKEVAEIFSQASGKTFTADMRPPEQFIKDYSTMQTPIDPYFIGVADFFKQLVDGRMGYVADVRDDLPQLIGRKGMSTREWADLHRQELLQLAA